MEKVYTTATSSLAHNSLLFTPFVPPSALKLLQHTISPPPVLVNPVDIDDDGIYSASSPVYSLLPFIPPPHVYAPLPFHQIDGKSMAERLDDALDSGRAPVGPSSAMLLPGSSGGRKQGTPVDSSLPYVVACVEPHI
jgi:hypothetical protein